MRQYPHLYIDGEWVDPVEPRYTELVDPAREEPFARVDSGAPPMPSAPSLRLDALSSASPPTRSTNGSR